MSKYRYRQINSQLTFRRSDSHSEFEYRSPYDDDRTDIKVRRIRREGATEDEVQMEIGIYEVKRSGRVFQTHASFILDAAGAALMIDALANKHKQEDES